MISDSLARVEMIFDAHGREVSLVPQFENLDMGLWRESSPDMFTRVSVFTFDGEWFKLIDSRSKSGYCCSSKLERV